MMSCCCQALHALICSSCGSYSHWGIPGNEKADQLAKEGATEEQTDTSVTYHQMKQKIKSNRKPQNVTHDDYHNMSRSEQVVIFRLRTGHNRPRSHMYTKFKIGNSAICTCGRAPQTAEHILQDCHEHDALRQTYWSTETTFQTKLYGPLQELQKIV
jgi:hypothetical protein